METTLDIKNREDDLRITITGKDNIKKFWLMNKLEGIDYDIIKKNRINNVDLIDYNTRISLSSEKIIDDKNSKYIKSNLAILTNDNKIKTYRLKNRYYIYDEKGDFRFDLTAVRSEDNTTFLKSNVMNKNYSYEIEMECLKRKDEDKNEDNISHGLIYNMSLILSLIQDFVIITKNTDIEKVIKSYSEIIGHKGNNKKYRGNKYENTYNARFIAANPVTIHPINLIKSSFIN